MTQRNRNIITKSAEALGITPETLKSREQKAEVSTARQLQWKVLRRQGLTFREIGEIYNRAGTTILNGITRVDELLETNDQLATEQWEKIKEFGNL